jgi:ABC-type nitrate/sulfonate/bicarbonate transport system substrate-binding protein
LTAAGGIRSQLAALKSGAVDAAMITLFAIAPLVVKGEVREVLHMVDYLPKPWMSRVVYARRDFLAKDPDSVGKMVKSLLQATKFVMANRGWTIEKMKSYSKYPPKAAELLYPKLIYSKDGRIDPKALSNVRQFLLDYKVISAADAPPLKELYTNQFTE